MQGVVPLAGGTASRSDMQLLDAHEVIADVS